ncbi:MAG: helix-turn-helix domain-containing protein [Clostridia bacterium]|nr:helix-turn-helix domain-containing protein [Clostridia bacterium]
MIERVVVEQYQNFEKLKYYYQLTYGKALLTREHCHEFYEVILLLKDNALHSFDGAEQQLMENDFIFISPDNRHCFLAQNKESNVFALSVERERFESFINAYQFTPVYGKIYHANSDRLVKKVYQIFENSDSAVYLANALLSDLFSYAVRDSVLNPNEGIPIAILDAIKLMRKPENLTLGVNRLSELSGYSRSQLNRLISKHYDKTPHEFLLDLQMSIARELIEHTNLSFEEIAAQVGFASTSRFYAVVKSYFGCTPGTLRRETKLF